MAKLRVGLIFGGRSVEHEVSVTSATSILQALDPEKYAISLIAVDHDGRWHLGERRVLPEASLEGEVVTVPTAPGAFALTPGGKAKSAVQLDVLFPIVHGRGGEDGTLQGLLELAEIAYVGSGVLGSAVQMDKDVAKRLLRAADLPVVPWHLVSNREQNWEREANAAIEELGFPVFVKPANSGSSVGISKANDLAGLLDSIAEAARYDTKILVEKAVDAREFEVAVLGNDDPEASVPGEIVASSEFYDYESKYVEDTTELVIPAPIPEALGNRLREYAVEAFTILSGSGLARVDFLLDRETKDVYINEVNSLPGFTDASMYPKLWEASGLSYPVLLDRLIELALERHAERAKLETVYRRG